MAIKKTIDGMEIIKRRFGIDPRTDPAVQAFAGMISTPVSE